MADGYDHFDKSFDYHEGGGGSFVMGLLTGTVLGAGLGMLFAPRAGSELRNKLSEQAGTMASEGYRRASESAGQWAEKGRDMYNKASEAVAKGADEAQRYVRDTAREAGVSTPGSSYEGGSSSSYGSSSTYGGSSESIRGSERDNPTTRRP
jgi:gas vesicle protein